MSKPFLKWAGGKYKLVPFIESNFPKSAKRKRLIEPFCGSAALSLSLEFDEYLLNDINTDLINLYRTLQKEKQNFIDYAKSFFTQENNTEKSFLFLRDLFNNSENIEERSALFIYLNRHSFNGLCRYNAKGKFNVPFGRYKSPYFPEPELQEFVKKSHRIQLSCGEFQAVLSQATAQDIIYCDPPYVPLSETASFTSYSQQGFNLKEQKHLADCSELAAQKSEIVLISNHDTQFTRDIYANAKLAFVEVQRNIAAKGESRKKIGELLAIYE